MKTKQTIFKILIILAMLAILAVAFAIFFSDKSKPVMPDTSGKSFTLEAGAEGNMVYDNYWAYVRKSYILIGSEPNYEYYKIASQVQRNDYIPANFYKDPETDKMYYHDEDGNKTTKLAVDVSTYQENIDWERLRNSGVEIAIIRVGYRGYGNGAIVLDEKFTTHIEGALEAGLGVGVYFFSQAISYDEGVEEASFVLDAIKSYDITYPVVIDSEAMYVEDARTEELEIEARTDSIIGFCETIKGAGYTPMIYSNRNWYAQSLDMTRLGDYELWVAHYTDTPDFPYLYRGWQYMDTGTLDGYDGAIDLNVWFD